jgi:hypothetical protein
MQNKFKVGDLLKVDHTYPEGSPADLITTKHERILRYKMNDVICEVVKVHNTLTPYVELWIPQLNINIELYEDYLKYANEK